MFLSAFRNWVLLFPWWAEFHSLNSLPFLILTVWWSSLRASFSYGMLLNWKWCTMGRCMVLWGTCFSINSCIHSIIYSATCVDWYSYVHCFLLHFRGWSSNPLVLSLLSHQYSLVSLQSLCFTDLVGCTLSLTWFFTCNPCQHEQN